MQADHSRRWRGPALRVQRMRQFFEAVAFVQKFLWSDASLRLLADPRKTPYQGPNLPLGAKTSSVWNHPECEASGVPVALRYFDVSMAEWRALCRRMLRSGLGKKVLPTSYPPHLSGGALSVPKDLDRDRFIGDRRPRNGRERLIGKCRLLWAPRLRRLTLPSDCVIRVHFRDVSDCYHAESVDEERLQRHVLGPRVPVSWFRNLEDGGLDFSLIEGVEPWVSSDLVQNPSTSVLSDSRGSGRHSVI